MIITLGAGARPGDEIEGGYPHETHRNTPVTDRNRWIHPVRLDVPHGRRGRHDRLVHRTVLRYRILHRVRRNQKN